MSMPPSRSSMAATLGRTHNEVGDLPGRAYPEKADDGSAADSRDSSLFDQITTAASLLTRPDELQQVPCAIIVLEEFVDDVVESEMARRRDDRGRRVLCGVGVRAVGVFDRVAAADGPDREADGESRLQGLEPHDGRGARQSSAATRRTAAACSPSTRSAAK